MKTMHIGIKCGNRRGFTLVELLVVIATIGMLAVLLLPALAQTSNHALRTQCLNNLKFINLSFHVWEDDHGGKYPTAVSTAIGGAMQNIYTQNTGGGGAKAGYGVTNVFCVMSNKLGTPKVLTCPADHSRTFRLGIDNPQSLATGPLATVATNWAGFGPQNLSYFVEGNASDRYPKMMLIGDRNIGTSLSWSTPAPAMNTGGSGYSNTQIIGVGFPSQKNIPSFPWEWTDSDIHKDGGNLGMADGSAQLASLSGLQIAITDTRLARGTGKLNVILNMP